MKPTKILVALAAFVFALPASAQIPVTVTTQVTDSPMTMAEFGQNTARWAQQVQQMTDQYKKLQQQYNAITGIRNLGDVLNNPALREYVGDEYKQSFDDISKGYNGLTSEAKTIYDKYKVFDNCGNITNAVSKANCYARAMRGSQNKAMWEKSFATSKNRIKQIEDLMKRAGLTQDSKEIAEIQARIQAETALLQNQAIMVNLQKQISEAEAEINSQRAREQISQSLKSGNGLDLEIMTFN